MNSMRLTRRGFVAISAVALVNACTPYGFETATRPGELTVADMTARVNAVRRANGRKPVTFNAQLAAAARSQARLMAQRDELSHDLGVTLRERVNEAGYVGAVGENLAGGHRTLEQAIEGWLGSFEHRNTLLSDKFVEFGLATADVPNGANSRYGRYWTLIMGGPYDAWY